MDFKNLAKGVIGGIVGGILAGPLGAILGFCYGLYQGLASESPNFRRINESERMGPILSQRGAQILFQCLGKLAKCDGRVSEDEAAFVKELMKAWKLDAATRRRFGLEFNFGRDSSAPFLFFVQNLADELSAIHATRATRRVIAQVFCSIVAADRFVHPEERRMLREAGRVLGVQNDVDAFFAGYREQKAHQESGESATDFSEQQCYEILSIPPSATDAQVKSAYRRKAKECHPDLAEGAGLSAATIQRAKEKFQKIGRAYDTIRQLRGMK